MVNKAFANAIINHCVPFQTCDGKNWDTFFKLGLEFAYKVQEKWEVTDTFLSISYDNISNKRTEEMNVTHEMYLTADGFLYVTSRSIF